jgi:hypothetical protein
VLKTWASGSALWLTSISTSRASSFPSRRSWRNFSRVWPPVSASAAPPSKGGVEEALLGVLGRALGDLLGRLALDQADRDLDQVADHALDVAPVVADLGVAAGLDLEERRADQAG